MEEPTEQRRIIRKNYNMAEVRLRKIFGIPDDEMILDFLYDKPNSTLILTTLKDCDEEHGDI